MLPFLQACADPVHTVAHSHLEAAAVWVIGLAQGYTSALVIREEQVLLLHFVHPDLSF